jgi:hypothetical protein
LQFDAWKGLILSRGLVSATAAVQKQWADGVTLIDVPRLIAVRVNMRGGKNFSLNWMIAIDRVTRWLI